LRSKGDVDVCKVAQVFDGGGHVKASGASFKGTIDEAIEAVVETIALQL
jgi:phosphoesterase RecJ-like protein